MNAHVVGVCDPNGHCEPAHAEGVHENLRKEAGAENVEPVIVGAKVRELAYKIGSGDKRN